MICEVLQTYGQNQVTLTLRKSLSYLSKIVKYNVTRVYKWVNDIVTSAGEAESARMKEKAREGKLEANRDSFHEPL